MISDMFVSLKKFAYDKEKMIQQAFLTLRRGLIERICPSELSVSYIIRVNVLYTMYISASEYG